MEKTTKTKWKTGLAGAAAGLIGGLFGSGGGMLLLPQLATQMERKRAHATCLAVMLLLSAASAALYLLSNRFAFSDVLPYLPGGIVGAIIGAWLLRKLPPNLLRRAFGLVVLAAGVRLLLK